MTRLKVASTTTTIVVVPLRAGAVLLPTGLQKVAIIGSTADIPALVSSFYERSTSNASVPVTVACVPISSSALRPNGQLLGEKDRSEGSLPWRKNGPREIVQAADLFDFGVAVKVISVEGDAEGQLSLVVQPEARLKVHKIAPKRPLFEGQVQLLPEEVTLDDSSVQERFTTLCDWSRALLAGIHFSNAFSKPHFASQLPSSTIFRIQRIVLQSDIRRAGLVSDIMAGLVETTVEEKLQVLATVDVKARMNRAIELVQRQLNTFKKNFDLDALTARSLRFQNGTSEPALARSISSLLNSKDFQVKSSGPIYGSEKDQAQEPSELDGLFQQLEAAQLPPDAAKLATRQLARLSKMVPMNPDYHVTMTWLETLAEIPWAVLTEDRFDQQTLAKARKQLDDDHYGLEKVKRRLLEYLAVLRLKQMNNDTIRDRKKALEQETDSSRDVELEAESEPSAQKRTRPGSVALESLGKGRMTDKAPILLLVGPPGVGKTSLAKSVAAAIGRRFHRVSLGGVTQEAEIRGHRRTYVAAMPGIIVQGLRKVGVANPVMLLDEIDKISSRNFNGDPSAALLEVLDPEQNYTFTDHYIGTPVDLSKVLFIATANSLDGIPAPLLDRMETIRIPGYTALEKRHIAMRHLVPRQIGGNGLTNETISFSIPVISKIIESYTRESGVRNLEREIGAVCRAKAVEFASARDADRLEAYRPVVTVEDVEQVLGIERFSQELAAETSQPGIVTGLAAYSSGSDGGIFFIEAVDMPGDGKMQLTGQLGAVLQESVGVALSWVKAHAFELGLTADGFANVMNGRTIHVHCPAGAVPKDGPSSGMAQAIALVSLFSTQPVPPKMAMTGELSLRGRVTAVGGIREKLIGALRAGVKTVILPKQNRNDLDDLPQEVKDGIRIQLVDHIWDAIRLVWPERRLPVERGFSGIQSRL